MCVSSDDDRPAAAAPALGDSADVTLDPAHAAEPPEPGAWNAPTTSDPDAMQDTPDELGGTAGENAGGAG
jgi:hypothetical protein